MKKFYPLLSVLFLIYWSCEDAVEEDKSPPTEVTLWGKVYLVDTTTVLNVQNQNLTGSIPSDIGYLINLKRLKLENNSLTGEIPSEIGNLTQLTLFSIGNNELNGKIPETICNLPDSSFFSAWVFGNNYCSFINNKLCPPYPTCVYDTSRYIGNEILDYVGEQDLSDCP